MSIDGFVLSHEEEDHLEQLAGLDFERNCYQCKHLHEDEQTCDAYPSGIPSMFLYLTRSHAKPSPGDQGITFEAIPCPYQRKKSTGYKKIPLPAMQPRRGHISSQDGGGKWT